MNGAHPYLTGPWAPLTEEQLLFDLEVEGRLPAGLDGLYVRTGPNPYPGRAGDRYHWLSGDGMVHGIRIQGGRALWYRNRWVNAPDVARARSMPAPPTLDALVPEGTGNSAAVCHAGRLLAFSEMAMPYELSDTLETLTMTDFGGPMPAGSIAHPRIDAVTGELHTLAYHPDPPYLRHHVVDAAGRMCEERALPVNRPMLVHDFGLTAEHLVLFDLPVLFDEEAMFEGQPLPYRWDEQAGAFLGLVPRKGDPAATEWFEIAPCWIPHVAAVRAAGTALTIEAVQRPALFRDDLRGDDEGPPTLLRFNLERRRQRVATEVIDADEQDMPCRDPRVAPGEDARYWTLGIGVTEDRHPPAGDRLYGRRVGEAERSEYSVPEGWLLSAPSFVPAHARAAHDEGWLVAFAHERDGARSRFLVMDASRPESGAVASVEIPARIPFGFHGCWVPD
ncbi:MAG: carotenoid oxygenase family protein [Pseudomonadales bacterium]|nr:carotenoid oxygenase family protein [Pseudomonadales bacterium]